MNCPSCGTNLSISDRSGIEVDYCPNCRGVWLDRGELDKIIERSQNNSFLHPKRREDRREDYRSKKKESFLGDLFDF